MDSSKSSIKKKKRKRIQKNSRLRAIQKRKLIFKNGKKQHTKPVTCKNRKWEKMRCIYST